MRHLSNFDLLWSLRNGRSVQQLLDGRREGGVEVIRYMGIYSERDGRWTVYLCEVADVGDPDYRALDTFPDMSTDPDEPVEEVFDSMEAALEYACAVLGADPQRFVNEGMVETEYTDVYHPEW